MIEILYRDPHFVVVHKPSGLAVHRGWAQDRDYAMTRTRDTIGAYVYPVHRLDRGTSGVLLFALCPQWAARAQALFEGSQVQKLYLALVRGITPETGHIDHPLKRPGSHGDPQPAQSEYLRVATRERYSFVLVKPKTGRTHQIRRHFKHISHHLIGDVRYGKGEHNRKARQAWNLHRLALHALALYLPYPHLKSEAQTPSPAAIHCVAAIPDDLRDLLFSCLSKADFEQKVRSFAPDIDVSGC